MFKTDAKLACGVYQLKAQQANGEAKDHNTHTQKNTPTPAASKQQCCMRELLSDMKDFRRQQLR